MKAVIKGPMKRSHMVAPVMLGVELADHREELFVIMACDGMPLGIAFRKAGFTSKDTAAPSKLWALDRCQQRALAIFEARKKASAVTLPQVTSMLERVFTSALHNENESAAHNAAFSLARLYGHVTDRAIVDVRKPSRDPDAPSERALTEWVAGLVDVSPNAAMLAGPGPADLASEGPRPSAPAAPLEREPQGPSPENHSDIKGLDEMNRDAIPAAGPSGPEKRSEINWLAEARGGSENGAPSSPVTGAPPSGGRTKPIDPFGPPGVKKPPPKTKRVPLKKREKAVVPRTRRQDPFK